MAKSDLQELFANAQKGKKYPILDVVRKDPQMAAVISKLVTPRDAPRYDQAGNRQITDPDSYSFRNISAGISDNIRDAKSIMKLLPEMELWSQILVASILSPKDMMTCEINFVPPADLLPSDVSSSLIAHVKNYFTQTYKIKQLLPDILRDVLFNTGSYPIAVIPENSLDHLINGSRPISMESISEFLTPEKDIPSLGLLGPKNLEKAAVVSSTGISFESLSIKPNSQKSHFSQEIDFNNAKFGKIFVRDNPDVLRIPQLNQRLREQHIKRIMGVSAMESTHHNKVSDSKITQLIYKQTNRTYKSLVSLKSSQQIHRRSVGEALILHLPSESVMPVHIPGKPEKQVGFFVLIDGDGNPISSMQSEDQYRQISSRLNVGTGGNFPSAMIERVNAMTGGDSNLFDPMNRLHIDYSVRAYGEFVEADLLSRIRNGIYGSGLSIANNQEVYRIMLARSLQGQNTQLLFIPEEMMTYFAFRYNENGIGRSHIDEIKILLSLRIMLMFANVMASIKNSIGRTEVKIKLDENDPNPQKAIETAIHEIVSSRQQYFPLGLTSPSDLVDWLRGAGFEFTFEGHPGLPDVSVDFGEKNTNYVKPDTDLEERLRKSSNMAVGLSPETVDAGSGAEFATSILANNILLSKRVIQIQEEFTPQITDHVRKITLGSEDLSQSIRETIKENLSKIKARLTEESAKLSDEVIIESVYQDFINGIEVTLPSPNSVTLDNQVTALDTYTKSLDSVLDSYLSDKFITDSTAGDISGDIGVAKEIIRAYFIRKWVSENGMLPELGAITASNEDGKPMINFFDEQKTHIAALAKSLSQLMISLKPNTDQTNEELQDAGVESSGVSSDTTSDDDTGGIGGDDDFGTSMGDTIGDMESPPEGTNDAATGTSDNVGGTEETPNTDDEATSNEDQGEDKDTEENKK